MTLRTAVLTSLLACLSWSSGARAQSLDAAIAALQHDWARAYYRVPEQQKQTAFDALEQQAAQATAEYPQRAEPLVWQAIVLSSAAKFQGGLGALKKIKQARELLLAAERIDPTALDGSIYTSLGSLYAKSPGWPLAFGDKKQARTYLQKALAQNPDGIDPNFFYGELLLELNDSAGARRHLEKALAAPARPGREDADQGRRAEVETVLAQVR